MPTNRDPQGVEIKLLHDYGDLDGARLLEIGCGNGDVLWRYAQTPREVVAIDLDFGSLVGAQNNRPDTLKTPVSIVQADGGILPFASASFDMALYTSSL